MYPSDLPDMYTHALGPPGPRAWVYISGKSQGHVIQLMCTMPMQAKSLRAINHPNQYDTDHRIHYIDQLVRFDYGTATTNGVTTFVTINGKILQISRNTQFSDFIKCFKVATSLKCCLHSFLNIQRGKLRCRVVTS